MIQRLLLRGRGRSLLTPALQKAEKCRFYQEIEGCCKGTIILKNSVLIRSIPFKCIFVRLEKALMRGKIEREIPLALYIRLEYSNDKDKLGHQHNLIGLPWAEN